MKKRNLLLMAGLLVGAAWMQSCTKKENKDTTAAQDNALAESMYDDVFKNVNEVAVKEEGVNKNGYAPNYTFANCGTVTLTPLDSTYPKVLTIDFGTTNCQGDDGRYRRGKIIATLTGKYKVTGTVLTIALDNYYVDDHKVEGTKTMTNAGNYTWNIVVSGGKVTYPNGEVATWASTRTRKMVAGQTTEVSLNPADSACFWNLGCLLDDAYEITGTANGINRKGVAYDVVVTTPVRVQFCGYIPEVTSGVVEIQPQNMLLRTVDFGNGVCDNEGTVKIKNKTYTFKLRGGN